MPAPLPLLTVSHLSHRYGAGLAVDDVSFEVERGSLFAFLGPNGAGKSTSISVLTTLIAAQSGTVEYVTASGATLTLGKDDPGIRSLIGVVFQDSLLDKKQTVEANLRTRARLYGRRRLSDLVESLQLDELLLRPYGKLSGGQRRRVDIARALVASPQILFLDEPTTGLDPASRALVWATIDSLRRDRELTVFLTTHYMEEAEAADRVTIIDHGSIIAEGTSAQLRATHASSRLKLSGPPALAEQLRTQGIEFTEAHGILTVPTASDAEAKQLLARYGELIGSFEYVHATMDDVFLSLTGAAPRDG